MWNWSGRSKEIATKFECKWEGGSYKGFDSLNYLIILLGTQYWLLGVLASVMRRKLFPLNSRILEKSISDFLITWEHSRIFVHVLFYISIGHSKDSLSSKFDVFPFCRQRNYSAAVKEIKWKIDGKISNILGNRKVLGYNVILRDVFCYFFNNSMFLPL